MFPPSLPLKVQPEHPRRERWKQVKLTNRALVELTGQSPVKGFKMMTETLMNSKNPFGKRLVENVWKDGGKTCKVIGQTYWPPL